VERQFVGRATEIEEFRRVLTLARRGKPLGPDSTDGPDEAHVVLIYGLGGIGKSTLLRRLREIAIQHGGRQILAAEVLDCEQRAWDLGEHASQTGPPIWKVLDHLYLRTLAGATGRRLRKKADAAFGDFRKAMAVQPENERRAAAIGIAPAFGRRRLGPQEISALSDLAGDAARAIDIVMPGAGKPARSAASGLARSALEVVADRASNKISTEAYDVLMANLDRLVAAFAHGLRELSRHAAPLVIFIDTGELLGGSLDFLRDAMRQSGQHVIWVVGLRMADEASAGMNSVAAAFGRFIDDTRLRRMPLRSFDDRTVQAYLDARLGPDHVGAPLDDVMRTTHGIPLAVSLTARLLADGVDPAIVLSPAHDGEVSGVVKALADRYLVHVQTVPKLKDDLLLLYGLALLYGPNREGRISAWLPDAWPAQPDPAALAAIWGVKVEKVAGLLNGLAGRHDFVLTEGRRLHQEVRETILLHLLDPVQRPTVKQMNERAVAYYSARAEGGAHPTVDAQFQDDGWQSNVTALLWHTFWTSFGMGIQLLCELCRAALTIDPGFAAVLARTAVFFAPMCSTRDRDLITAIEDPPFSFMRIRRGRRDMITAIASRAAGQVLASSPPAGTYDALLRAAYAGDLGLSVLEQARLLVRAAHDVPEDGPTGQAIANTAYNLASRLSGYHDPRSESQQVLVSALRLIGSYRPDDSFAHVGLGNALVDLGRYEEAETAYREAIRTDPDHATAHNNLGVALAYLDRYAEAETAYREAIRTDPDHATAHYGLGNALINLDRYAEAETAYREAIRINPDYATAHYELGNALFDLDRYAEAETAYREAIRINPDYATAHNGLGNALIDLDRYAEAETACREAIRIDPDYVQARNNLGTILAALGHYDDAKAEFEEALRLDPDHAKAHRSLGTLYLYAFDDEDASYAALRESFRCAPDYPSAHSKLGELHVATGNTSTAEECFRKAEEALAPDISPYVEIMLGVLERKTTDSAARHFASALTALGGPIREKVLFSPFRRAELRAIALAGLGRDEEAIATFPATAPHPTGADFYRVREYELFAARMPGNAIAEMMNMWRQIKGNSGGTTTATD
jgi:tetratricopeptide (TPR) repeat protein